jgi:exodeoxyribonuclease VII small subunit
MKFEDATRRLSEIVEELERQDLELARALELFQEGVQCLRAATSELARAETTVQRLVERSDGSFELEDLGGGG